MEWTSEEIKKEFNGVMRDTKLLNSEELEKKYAKFKESFSKLYEVAIDSVISGRIQESANMLQMMLDARASMNSGKTTKLTTDMFIGNQLGKKYIYPKTNVPSADDYKAAFTTIKEKANGNE